MIKPLRLEIAVGRRFKSCRPQPRYFSNLYPECAVFEFGPEFVIGFIRIFCMVLYMSKDVDLSDNVDEVEDQIRDAENPDYEALLEEEKSGKDRKTIKEFLQKKIDSQETEVTEAEDEVVEQIEEETSGGLLGGLSRDKVLGAGLAAGLVLGLIFGVAVGYATGGPDADITSEEAEDRLTQLFEAEQGLESFSVDSVNTQNGMYYIESTLEQEVEQENETTTEEFPQNFYMTLDGVYLFQEQQNQMTGQVVSPIDIDQTLEQMQGQTEQPQQPSQEELPDDLEEELEEQIE